MAHYLAELYTPKQAWRDLTDDQRQQFFAGIGSAMPAPSALGVEALTLGKVDQSKLHSSKHSFFAIGAARMMLRWRRFWPRHRAIGLARLFRHKQRRPAKAPISWATSHSLAKPHKVLPDAAALVSPHPIRAALAVARRQNSMTSLLQALAVAEHLNFHHAAKRFARASRVSKACQSRR